MFAFQRTVSRLTEMQTEEYWVEGDRSTTWPPPMDTRHNPLKSPAEPGLSTSAGSWKEEHLRWWWWWWAGEQMSCVQILSHSFLMPFQFTPLAWRGKMYLPIILPLHMGTLPQFSEFKWKAKCAVWAGYALVRCFLQVCVVNWIGITHQCLQGNLKTAMQSGLKIEVSLKKCRTDTVVLFSLVWPITIRPARIDIWSYVQHYHTRLKYNLKIMPWDQSLINLLLNWIWICTVCLLNLIDTLYAHVINI